ncbi:MAG: N-acetylglucosamine-6-phosphate deacetylase [Planctomycetota bacterium]|nr:N-acetylglucosamine-6-phosphate deacetylase [Planctomycetota bacterium]
MLHRDATRNGILLAGAEVLAGGRAGDGAVLVRGRRIAALGREARRLARRDGARVVDLDGGYLAPGLIDLHTHGAVGVDFVEASREEFARAMKHYVAHGVTSLLVSLYPSSWKRSLEVLERIASYLTDEVGGLVAFGIHLEGPFLSPHNPGALPKRHFRPCSTRDAARLLEAGRGTVKTVTVAPELQRSGELIRFLRRRGVVPAFGHSCADYETTRRALGQGVQYVTHLFNAMTGMHHRAPGAVAALLEDPDVAVEIIGDGHHVDIPVLRLVHRSKPPDRVILVSDSVHPCGLPAGRYQFAGDAVIVRGGRIQREDGTLAGSALTLDRALAIQVRRVGLPVDAAVKCCTANPARAVGVERSRGRIARGRRADLVLLDDRLRPQATWLAGELVHARDRSRFA